MMSSGSEVNFSSPEQSSSFASSDDLELDSELARFVSAGMEDLLTSEWLVGITTKLTVTRQPVDVFRYRYKSECEKGKHGSLYAVNGTKKNQLFPQVTLENYMEPDPIIVRASLFTNDTHPIPHVHLLSGSSCSEGYCCVKLENDYTAVFPNMSIQESKREHSLEILTQRKKREVRREKLTAVEQKEIVRLEKEMDKNCVRICFEAFLEGSQAPLCPPVYSRPIRNSRPAASGDLKICRVSRVTGSCRGNEEVFLFCNKVKKDGVKIMFYDEDFSWQAEGQFSASDVHHQVAIAFRTPPYRDLHITAEVAVKFHLLREKDNKCSEPRDFIYKPDENDQARLCRKRMRMDDLEELLYIPGVENSELQGMELQSVFDVNNILGPVTQSLQIDAVSSAASGIQWEMEDERRMSPIPKRSMNQSLQIDAVLRPSDDGSDSFIQTDGLPSESKEVEGQMGGVQVVPETPSNDVRKMYRDIATQVVRFGEIHPSLRRNPGWIFCQNRDGDNLLHLAIIHQTKNVGLLGRLLALSVNSRGPINRQNELKQTPLFLAVVANEKEAVGLLLRYGANPNLRDNKGDTCSHIAVRRDDVGCLRELVYNNKAPHFPDFKLLNDEGYSVLHEAIVAKNAEGAELLLRFQGVINQRETRAGRTPLHLAVVHDPSLLSLLLIQPEVEVDAQDAAGNTPLHLACMSGVPSAVRALRRAAADVNLRNFHQGVSTGQLGLTPTDLAVDNPEILHILCNTAANATCLETSAVFPRERSATEGLLDSTVKDRLCTALDPPSVQWKVLGHYLGLEDRELEDIALLHDSPTSCLIDLSLRKSKGVKDLEALLELAELSEALRILRCS